MSDSDSDGELQELIKNPGVYREIQQPRPYINNKPMLANTLERINNRLPWIERLDIVTGPAPPPKDTGLDNDIASIDPNDDFKREAYFYRQAQAAVLLALPKLHNLNVPTKRPTDYFAEMVKSDEHMLKIREHIVVNKKRLELKEKARQLREQRKFGKQQHKEILETRRVEKKKHMDALKAAKKKPGGKAAAQVLQEFLTSDKKRSKKTRDNDEDKSFFRPKDVANRRKINHNREFKNQKYGHGGQKKRGKRNDSGSIRRMESSEVKVLSHKASSDRINKLKKTMVKSKKKNTMKQKKRLSRM